VKLLSHADGKYVIRLDSREHDALLAAIGLRPHLPRAPRSLTADTAVEPGLRAAQGDLDAALTEHRQELTTSIDQLLADPEKVSSQGKGKVLTLTSDEIALVLQGLNDVRVAAWERLGCPNFDEGERPEVNQENFLCLWTIQATDLFQSFLLAVLAGETD
jgi:hypothetical protein